MQKEIVFIFAGVVLCILIALYIETRRSRTKNIASGTNQTDNAKAEPNTGLPSTAWLRLVETSHGSGLFPKQQTEEQSSIDISKKAQSEQISGTVESSLEPYPLSSSQIIGRHEKCGIRLSDVTVSRHHAKIISTHNQYVVYDLNSKSGTFVNDIQVPHGGTPLQSGDILRVGDTMFIYEGSPTPETNHLENQENSALITQPPKFKKKKKHSSA